MSEFLTKDDFHNYVIDNRDRQDANKSEIIDTLQETINGRVEDLDDDIEKLGGRVTNLELDNRKQTRVAGGITALGAVLLGLLAYLK